MTRLQRSSLSMLRRLSGQNMISEGDFEIAPFVFLTLGLGNDRTDLERVVFRFGAGVAAGAALFPSVILEAHVKELELLAAWASRGSGVLTLGWEFRNADTIAIGSGATRSSTGAAAAARAGGTDALPIVGAMMTAPANVLIDVPVAGIVLPVGRALRLCSEAAATTMFGGFVWRELQTASS
jgi:hypothetical protein